jgi:hypothetical protein
VTTPTRYRVKNPGTVEAIQFNGLVDYRAIVDWMRACVDTYALADEIGYSTPEMHIHTPRGRESARPGDWIVRGVTGLFFIARADEFFTIYEPEGDDQ